MSDKYYDEHGNEVTKDEWLLSQGIYPEGDSATSEVGEETSGGWTKEQLEFFIQEGIQPNDKGVYDNPDDDDVMGG